jgi:glutathione S-transferase
MKIIEQTRTPNPRRVRIFLAEKGITVPFEQADIARQELKTAEFTRLNPFQQVPVLVLDDGTAISESVAICRYFEEIEPEPNLMGRSAVEKAVIEMWNRRVELGLMLSVTHCFRHTHPAMASLEVPQVPAWGEANRARILQHLELLDRELAAREFVAGGRFTIADITAFVAVDFLRPIKFERPASLTHLDRWYRAVAARPSAKA